MYICTSITGLLIMVVVTTGRGYLGEGVLGRESRGTYMSVCSV